MAEHHYSTSMTRRGERALENLPHDSYEAGLNDYQHWGLVLGGAGLALYGAYRRDLRGLFLAGVGAGLAYRKLKNTGMLDGRLRRMALNTGASRLVEIEKSITIDRPVDEVYSYWRRLENLPLFMRHIRAIDVIDSRRSIWRARMPRGLELEWEAEIIDEQPNALLAWRSVHGTDIYNEGYVTFHPARGGRATELHATIIYRPPAGAVGQKLMEFFNRVPEEIIKEDLRNFKSLIEAGEIATIEGQPAARSNGNGHRKLSNGDDTPTALH